MTVYGYARVSTEDQNLDLQINALEEAGCEHILSDFGVGGTSKKRVELSSLLERLEPGDTLIVWRLDRLARSMIELVEIVQDLRSRDVTFRSLCEYIDVDSAFGELILHILSAIAHFERALIVERTRAGMRAAKDRGVEIGRKPVLSDAKLRKAQHLVEHGMNVKDTAAHLGVGRSTLYRYLRQFGDNTLHLSRG